MLEVKDLHSGYGRIEILKGLSLKVPAGQIVTLIGANGAGKTTSLMTLSGIIPIRKGQILFEGKPIEKMASDERVKLGIVQVPEGRRIFSHMTVQENLDLGAYLRQDREIKKDRTELLELFPILRDRLQQLAGNMSGGEQQMLAMARALMARPRLLLLDEPSLGLAPKMIDTVFQLIRRINKRGITVLLVEQNAWKALEIATHAYVIETGKIKLEGAGKDLLTNPVVKQLYLGE
jgi:branched-chain amino acid transport system ATP-binding protein